MSNADVRAAIATAVSTVEGITGYVKRPAVVKTGDAWPQWRGSERADGAAFLNTWAVLIALPNDDATADEWADSYGEALVDALRAELFVTNLAPALIPMSGTDTYALMITGVSE